MDSIEIVTHCWSGPDVPVYHRLLDYQLQSLSEAARLVPELNITGTVFITFGDWRAIEVMNHHFGLDKSANFDLWLLYLPESELFRRAIGRNRAAKATKSNVVWFTDCDYFFDARALQQAHDLCLASKKNIVHPKDVYTNTHADGDWAVEERRTLAEVRNRKGAFSSRRMNRAIGGIQIVKGDYCREHGYLDGTDWVEPVESDHFLSCKGDVAFRKAAGGSEGVDISMVHRIRHSRAGRDKGQKDHAKA